ncbi:hypothetical protein BQ02730 [Bartonella quintana str. Toulouse]|uniref:Uncharacterized protein n=1 Tax=Bartonella quintana (strain Toulouse) TaxID=283165 RepID=A0A0H3LVA5_BARQU|nr:hypothetical protein BQ02730 [Bartonella quintana str. Toulouse]
MIISKRSTVNFISILRDMKSAEMTLISNITYFLCFLGNGIIIKNSDDILKINHKNHYFSMNKLAKFLLK